jgi:hypothetical protein
MIVGSGTGAGGEKDSGVNQDNQHRLFDGNMGTFLNFSTQNFIVL